MTLGGRNINESSINNQPIIGDNVLISTGCKVLGNVVVGNNVNLGANSVVLNDCLSNSTYVGIPAEKK